ncbi:lipid A biosynthesis lauroyltransferase [Steroidobacter agaridevorans]|uniref:Lipid A biosynthesis acyltransferase n=1 Tax=Steroidobacter agaridevorans TaxID=2695856 RepID=A0A829YNI7_9GAMM|nr:LpxL/LpxP family Kdo(2)-lipid IV(A) lauroyl/palmitoleoyl acyltransferase [Steroidobacter agaridevorans]GFE84056.1 lipid A biosynthesis lauroyltransferase [Steroidobacter agaridevorans]GFE91507.1 lipid A biosynthesis lauroyltransferase [Steroidobacter agaridevorans]
MKTLLPLLRPHYWPTWLAIGTLKALQPLPVPVLTVLGRALGSLAVRLPLSFVRIARTNMGICLPELSDAQRELLLKEHFKSLGLGIFETAIAWWGSQRRIAKLTQLEGIEHLRTALERGKGAILLSAHFTTLEIGGRVLCDQLAHEVNIMYRPTSNAVLERFLMRNRSHQAKRAIPRDDVRTLITSLRTNEPVWYAPDQAYRKKGAEMVPFFGIPAATNTATSRLARMTGAAVLPYFQERLPSGKYRMVIYPMLEEFPSDDPVADAKRFNHLIELQVRRTPEQYLWIHRRFKGLTPDYPDYYKRKKAS